MLIGNLVTAALEKVGDTTRFDPARARISTTKLAISASTLAFSAKVSSLRTTSSTKIDESAVAAVDLTQNTARSIPSGTSTVTLILLNCP